MSRYKASAIEKKGKCNKAEFRHVRWQPYTKMTFNPKYIFSVSYDHEFCISVSVGNFTIGEVSLLHGEYNYTAKSFELHNSQLYDFILLLKKIGAALSEKGHEEKVYFVHKINDQCHTCAWSPGAPRSPRILNFEPGDRGERRARRALGFRAAQPSQYCSKFSPVTLTGEFDWFFFARKVKKSRLFTFLGLWERQNF